MGLGTFMSLLGWMAKYAENFPFKVFAIVTKINSQDDSEASLN